MAVHHRCKMLVDGLQNFPILLQTASWMHEHFVGEASAISQPTRSTQPTIHPWSINL